jgi:hypothetical protein
MTMMMMMMMMMIMMMMMMMIMMMMMMSDLGEQVVEGLVDGAEVGALLQHRLHAACEPATGQHQPHHPLPPLLVIVITITMTTMSRTSVIGITRRAHGSTCVHLPCSQ